MQYYSSTFGSIAEKMGFVLCSSAIVYVIVAMSIVYLHIRDIEVKAARYTFAAYSSSQAAERKRSRRVMIQGIMYAVAMMPVILPWMFAVFFTNGYASLMKSSILIPLQGFYNAFIYIQASFKSGFTTMMGGIAYAAPLLVYTLQSKASFLQYVSASQLETMKGLLNIKKIHCHHLHQTHSLKKEPTMFPVSRSI